MAKIDVKFMKGNRQLAKALGSTYSAGKSKSSGTATKKRTVKRSTGK